MPVTFTPSEFPDTNFGPDYSGQLLETGEGLEFVNTRAEPSLSYGPHGFPFEADGIPRSPAPQVPRPRPPGIGVGLLVVGLVLAILAVTGAASLLVSIIAPGAIR